MTLPSLHPTALDRTLRDARQKTRGELEIIVVSPEPPASEHGAIWIRETERRGCNAGHEAAFAAVTGDVVMAWVDDHTLVDGWDDIATRDLEFYEQTADRGREVLLGLRQTRPQQIGTVFGVYYPYFPMMRTSLARRVGWFDGRYRRGFADCDLALRVWHAGGVARWSSGGLVIVHEDDARKGDEPACAEGDMELFLSRWGSSFGAGWKTNDLRDFNQDFDLFSGDLRIEHARRRS